MKNNKIKLISTGIIVLSIILITVCSKKSTEPENGDSTTPSALVGTWNSTSIIMNMIITINSAQTAVDPFSEGTGAISITGAHQADLKYMVRMEEEGMSGLFISNQQLLEQMGNIEYPFYGLILFEQQNMAMFMVQTSATDTVAFIGLFAGFSYNPTTYTLTATNAQLFAMDFTTSVTVNGTLSNVTVNVPANTPTKIFSMEDPEDMQMTFTLSADGTYTGTTVTGDSVETETGTWETSGSTLTMITADTVDSVVEIDTMTATYNISSGVLTIIQETDGCEEFEDLTPAECLVDIEEQFSLEGGSLTTLTLEMIITFSKAAARWLPQPAKITNQSGLKSMLNRFHKIKANQEFLKNLNNIKFN